MLLAILASILTLVAIVAVLVFVLKFVRTHRSENVGTRKKASTIQSVGVKSSLNDYMPKHASSTTVSQTGQSSGVMSESLKSRFMALAVFAGAIFGTLTVKLWSMQVLSSSKYASESEENKYSIVYTPAPRGYIYDADGLALVTNRSSLTVLAEADVANDRDVLLRLSTVLGIPYTVVKQRIEDESSGAQSQRVVASDVRMRDVAFISEHSDAFSGVTVETRAVRDYPYGALAAHALGYTGSVSEEDLENVADGRTLELGDDAGKSGVEATYDNLLAGDHGQRKVMADSQGNVVEVVSETQPTQGSDIVLSLKGPVQYACDKLLADLVAPNGVIGAGTGTAAALVVLDVTDGSVVAMSSYPTFAPGTFTDGIPQSVWDVYNTEGSRYPLMNRVIAGTYPAASTYKAFTSLAALECGVATDESAWTCTGSWDGWDTGSPQNCWLLTGHGTLNLHDGIVNSCDVVFYEIAKAFWDNQDTLGETALQDFIHKFRFGEYTGIDLSGEAQGRIPTPEWKEEYFADYPEEAQWRGGDMTNMIIGQGYVLVTPIQLACGYAAVATGKMMKPHLLKEVRNASGETVLSFEPEVLTTIDDVDPEHLSLVRDALRGVVINNTTIAEAFSSYGIEAAGKTGTAEVAGKQEYSWFATYAPYDDPKYVAACIVEEGGGGSEAAAPVGAAALNAAFAYDRGELSDMGSVAGSTGDYVEYTGSSSGRTD